MLSISLIIIFISSISPGFGGDEFEDYRCRCVCPSFTVVDKQVNETNRRVYIDVVPPNRCDCEHVVFRDIVVSDNFQKSFCPRCACNYEVRNTTTMKVVVIIIMVAISLLFIYMSFLLCLDPLMNQNNKAGTGTTGAVRQPKNYQRQVNEELDNPTQECVFGETTTNESQTNRQRQSTVLNLVTHGQSKWRRQVHQQRESVYNKHELLN